MEDGWGTEDGWRRGAGQSVGGDVEGEVGGADLAGCVVVVVALQADEAVAEIAITVVLGDGVVIGQGERDGVAACAEVDKVEARVFAVATRQGRERLGRKPSSLDATKVAVGPVPLNSDRYESNPPEDMTVPFASSRRASSQPSCIRPLPSTMENSSSVI